MKLQICFFLKKPSLVIISVLKLQEHHAQSSLLDIFILGISALISLISVLISLKKMKKRNIFIEGCSFHVYLILTFFVSITQTNVMKIVF